MPSNPFTRPIRMLTGLLAGLLLGGCGGGPEEVVELEQELARALRLMESLNFNEAAPIYERVFTDLPADDPHWPEAATGHATCSWHRTPPGADDLERAMTVFGQIAARLPGTDWAWSARLNLARIHMLRDFPGDTENPAAAIPLLEELIATADGYLQHEALLRLVECHRMYFHEPERLREAERLLRDWLARHPANPLASAMWEQLAWMELHDFDRKEEALRCFLAAEKAGFLDPSRKGALLWRMAVLAEEVGEHATAVRTYSRLIREAPTSGRAYEAQLALQRIRDSVAGMQDLRIPKLSIGGVE